MFSPTQPCTSDRAATQGIEAPKDDLIPINDDGAHVEDDSSPSVCPPNNDEDEQRNDNELAQHESPVGFAETIGNSPFKFLPLNQFGDGQDPFNMTFLTVEDDATESKFEYFDTLKSSGELLNYDARHPKPKYWPYQHDEKEEELEQEGPEAWDQFDDMDDTEDSPSPHAHNSPLLQREVTEEEVKQFHDQYREERSTQWQCTKCTSWNPKDVIECLACGPMGQCKSSMRTSNHNYTETDEMVEAYKQYVEKRCVLKNQINQNLTARNSNLKATRIETDDIMIAVAGEGAISGVLGVGNESVSSIPDNVASFPVLLTMIGKPIKLTAAGIMSSAAVVDGENGDELYVWGVNDKSELTINPLNLDDVDLGSDDDDEEVDDESTDNVNQSEKHKKMEIDDDDDDDDAPNDPDNPVDCKSNDDELVPKFDRNGSINTFHEDEIQKKYGCTYWTPALVRLPCKMKIVQVTLGGTHMVVLDSLGRVYSSGTFSEGGESKGHHYDKIRKELVIYQRELKQITNNEFLGDTLMPSIINQNVLPSIKAIASGLNYFMMLDYNGFIWTMGMIKVGQKTCERNIKKYLCPQRITAFPRKGRGGKRRNVRFEKIECGDHHNLAISRDGQLYSWGQNVWIQCGHPKKQNAFGNVVDTPRWVPFYKTKQNVNDEEEENESVDYRIIDVVAGEHMTVALDNEGNVWTCGRNACYALGRKTRNKGMESVGGQQVNTEVQPDLMRKVIDLEKVHIDWIGCGSVVWFAHSKHSGAVYAFGDASSGRAGIGKWKYARGRPVFDEHNLDLINFEVTSANGGSDHVVFTIKRKQKRKIGVHATGPNINPTKRKRTREEMLSPIMGPIFEEEEEEEQDSAPPKKRPKLRKHMVETPKLQCNNSKTTM